MTKDIRAEAARIEEILRKEGLAKGEFDHSIARPQVINPLAYRHDTPEETAQEFLEQHPWPNTKLGRWERHVWELHAAKVSNRAISAQVRTSRKTVNATVKRLKRLADGRISGKRKPGRPADLQLGRGAKGVLRVVTRFNEVEAGALFYAEDKLRLAGIIPPVRVRRVQGRDVRVCDLAVVLRLAIRHFAGTL